ncbi:hypothetical protein UFOVP53_191 [uncultured Caudovirales phage]|uniref:Putative phage metallopeptidase domain-containing protein n=1 Tax=uncultured Caudovirales phage TaxID=2100421 RepID=A0A6J5KUJ6_9CAUD|nr:hypothetical protein UFOVP53_191 [uncultured Caudovirales phage]
MKVSILMLIVLTSCGKHHKDPRTNHVTNEAFTSHIKSFENVYGNKIGDIPVYFKDQDGNIAGVCLAWTTGEKAIEIDEVEWGYLSDKQQEQLIFHELGHCKLGLEHNDNYRYDATGYRLCPSSIMNPSVFSDYSIDNCYIPEFSQYTKELFKR